MAAQCSPYFFYFATMLKERLYRITAQDHSEGEASFTIALDPEDPVFQGHFPGQPVLPGACMMEVGRELLGELYGTSFELQYAKNMKIPAMVDPQSTPDLTVGMSYKQQEGTGGVELKYDISAGGTIFFKFSGIFRASGS